jgi:hypothetical protein
MLVPSSRFSALRWWKELGLNTVLLKNSLKLLSYTDISISDESKDKSKPSTQYFQLMSYTDYS